MGLVMSLWGPAWLWGPLGQKLMLGYMEVGLVARTVGAGLVLGQA